MQRFTETSANDKWWAGLTKDQKDAYIKAHPKSKHARNAGPPVAPASKPAAKKKQADVITAPKDTPAKMKNEIVFEDGRGKVKAPKATKPPAKRPSWPVTPKKSYEGEKNPQDGLLKNLNPSETGKVPAKKVGQDAIEKFRAKNKPATVPKKAKAPVSDARVARINTKIEKRQQQISGVKKKIAQLTKEGAAPEKIATYSARQAFLTERLSMYKKQLAGGTGKAAPKKASGEFLPGGVIRKGSKEEKENIKMNKERNKLNLKEGAPMPTKSPKTVVTPVATGDKKLAYFDQMIKECHEAIYYSKRYIKDMKKQKYDEGIRRGIGQLEREEGELADYMADKEKYLKRLAKKAVK